MVTIVTGPLWPHSCRMQMKLFISHKIQVLSCRGREEEEERGKRVEEKIM